MCPLKYTLIPEHGKHVWAILCICCTDSGMHSYWTWWFQKSSVSMLPKYCEWPAIKDIWREGFTVPQLVQYPGYKQATHLAHCTVFMHPRHTYTCPCNLDVLFNRVLSALASHLYHVLPNSGYFPHQVVTPCWTATLPKYACPTNRS